MTGVQTCALPILSPGPIRKGHEPVRECLAGFVEFIHIGKALSSLVDSIGLISDE